MQRLWADATWLSHVSVEGMAIGGDWEGNEGEMWNEESVGARVKVLVAG